MDYSKSTEFSIAIRMASCSDGPDSQQPRPLTVKYIDTTEAAVLSRNRDALTKKATALKVQPPLFLSTDDRLALLKELSIRKQSPYGFPRIIAWEGRGIFVAGQTLQEASWLAQSVTVEDSFPEPAASNTPGRLRGFVSAVTGSAQGFGKGIAEELAREGAAVIIADLNVELGEAFSAELNEKYGATTAIFCKVDVTDIESVKAMAERCVREFGGLDLMVSNAGVLKAGGIMEMDEKSFDLVTSVNYKAYFLCVKAITPILKLQHECNGAHFTDIIQINSKSGLAGSNKNFAYAGSKFGGIGLTQSFAMELIEYNVKVNSICPGNFFEGPLWSDPEKGLFVQYLRAGKVPGATTIDEVKKFYTDKVPMKRGCSPQDVAKAIFYLCDQLYETGQAVPVTGGQNMLN